MSHQNLKKNSGIHIDHKRGKLCKNEGFLKPSLFQICKIYLILTKNGSSGSGEQGTQTQKLWDIYISDLPRN